MTIKLVKRYSYQNYTNFPLPFQPLVPPLVLILPSVHWLFMSKNLEMNEKKKILLRLVANYEYDLKWSSYSSGKRSTQ